RLTSILLPYTTLLRSGCETLLPPAESAPGFAASFHRFGMPAHLCRPRGQTAGWLRQTVSELVSLHFSPFVLFPSCAQPVHTQPADRKSTRLNSSHVTI